MKIPLASALIACAFGLAVQAADVTVRINNGDLCCKGCVTGVEKAVGEVPSATASADKDALISDTAEFNTAGPD